MTVTNLAQSASAGWKRFIGHPDHDQVPVPSPSIPLISKLLIDQTILFFMSGTSGFWARPGEVDLSVQNEVAQAIHLYSDMGWIENPTSYHQQPPHLSAPEITHVNGWWKYDHLRFSSDYEPYDEEPGRDRWLGYLENRTAHAWVLKHRGKEDRPWMLTIHGYGMGHPSTDLTGIRANYLHKELGLNVLCYVMPLHGPRGKGDRGAELFRGGVTNLIHAEAQAMWDLRRLLHWIRSSCGATKIGVHGLSLGGYTAALLTGLVPDIDCAIAGIPAADFIDLFRRHMPPDYGPIPKRLTQFWHDAREVLKVVSPLVLKPLLPRHRRYIFAGVVDRLVPPEVALQLWEHWEQPRIAWYSGSHSSFLIEEDVRLLLDEALSSNGFLDKVEL